MTRNITLGYWFVARDRIKVGRRYQNTSGCFLERGMRRDVKEAKDFCGKAWRFTKYYEQRNKSSMIQKVDCHYIATTQKLLRYNLRFAEVDQSGVTLLLLKNASPKTIAG